MCIIYKKALILLFILFLLSVTCQAWSAQTITISTGSYPPFTGETLKHKGFVCHVVKTAFNNAGYKVKFIFQNWDKAYKSLLQGKVDASAYWYNDAYKRKDCYYSYPLTREKMVFFHLKSQKLNWYQLEDLKNYKIGYYKGVTYNQKFVQMIQKNILKGVHIESFTGGFKKLIAKKIDLLPCSIAVGDELLGKKFSNSVAKTIDYGSKTLIEPTGHILFLAGNKRSRALLEEFNHELQIMKENGTYSWYEKNLYQGYY